MDKGAEHEIVRIMNNPDMYKVRLVHKQTCWLSLVKKHIPTFETTILLFEGEEGFHPGEAEKPRGR